MKKIFKSRVFIVIITMIICISGTLYAGAKYQASEILFNPSSGDSMTVNDALNELYNKNDSESIYYLGTGTSFDIKEILPNVNYEKLSEDNFIVGVKTISDLDGTKVTGWSHQYLSSHFTGFSIIKKYDDETGILTISGLEYKTIACNDDSFLYCSDISVKNNATPYTYLIIGKINTI